MIIILELFLLAVNGIILTGLIQKLTILDYQKRARAESIHLASSKGWRNRC